MTTIDYVALFSMPVAGAIVGLIAYLYTGPKARLIKASDSRRERSVSRD